MPFAHLHSRHCAAAAWCSALSCCSSGCAAAYVDVGRPAEHTAKKATPLGGCALQAGELGQVVVRAEAPA
eukprot:scaffold120900_cov36-Phaeocystis_antarctica.AAC.2